MLNQRTIHQTEILDLVNTKVASGEREIHIVAPPGAGKTIIGLQLISTLKCPSLILSREHDDSITMGRKGIYLCHQI